MKYYISELTPISENKVKVIVSTYCGSLCASGSTVILELVKGKWKVISSNMNWISKAEGHNK